jgi:hypothetical protein
MMAEITAFLAVYSAALASVLAAIQISNFLENRKVLSISPELTLNIESGANYYFYIANTSKGPITIVDCCIYDLIFDQKGKLEQDWGIAPNTAKSMDYEFDEKIELPMMLNVGQVAILGISSGELAKHYSERDSFSERLSETPKARHPTKMLFSLKIASHHPWHDIEFELIFNEKSGQIKMAEGKHHKTKSVVVSQFEFASSRFL